MEDPRAELEMLRKRKRLAELEAKAGGGAASPYDTRLAAGEEAGFQSWKQQNAPSDSGMDYDLRGAFKAGVTRDPVTGHMPDTFKKPNHPTFSNESQYGRVPYAAAAKAGSWVGEQYFPAGQPRPGDSPFRGGVRGEKTLAGTAKPWTPEEVEASKQGRTDFVRGAAIGAPASVLGMPGDLESLARLPLSLAGVSTDSFLPTSTEVGNYIGGEPRSRQEEGGRGIGTLAGPPLAMAGAHKLGQLAAPLVKGGAIRPGAQEVRAAGYAIPPNLAQEKPSLVTRGLSAWGGKTKLDQAASIKNQQVTNAIAAKELGISPGTQLTKETFDAVRSEAGKAYGAVAQAMPEVSTDLTFASGVKQLGGRANKAAQEFPGIFENGGVEKLVETLSRSDRFSTQAALDTVRQLRADAGAHLKAFDDPARKALGQAQRAAADLIDGLLERRLAQVGNDTLMNGYRQARQLIAKSHDVEAATNLATGEVSALDLARMADKGRPLTGGLAAIAKMGGAFPQAAREATRYGGGESHSVTDLAAALASGAAGRYDLAGAIAARPIARSAILSNPYQNAILGAGNANVPGASAITPRLLGMMSAQNLLRLSQGRNEPR